MILRESESSTQVPVYHLPPRVTCSEWNYVQG